MIKVSSFFVAQSIRKLIMFALLELRPTLGSILQSPFFSCGPFPASLSTGGMEYAPDYRNVSIRASGRNFEAVKLQAGIIPGKLALSQPIVKVVVETELAVVPEEEEVERMDVDLVREAEVVVGARRGMEKEVREVLQPGSPISDLLRLVLIILFQFLRSLIHSASFLDRLENLLSFYHHHQLLLSLLVMLMNLDLFFNVNY